MKLMQQLIRTLIMVLALLVLGISHLLGDDPEQTPAASDQQVATEGVASEDVSASEDVATELPSDPTEEMPLVNAEVESPFGVPVLPPVQDVPAILDSGSQSAEIETAVIDREPSLNSSDAGIVPEKAYPIDLSGNAASEFNSAYVETNTTASESDDCLSKEAPYPDITEFPVPAAAFYRDPSAVREAELASSWEDGETLDNVTPAEYAPDCEWLVEKLDGYRNAQSDSEPQRFQETSPLSEVPQVSPSNEYSASADTSSLPIAEPSPYTEAPSIEEPETLQSNPAYVQDPLAFPGEQPLAEEVQPASAISLGQTIEPKVLVPPATIIPQSPLNHVLDQRTLAAVYGIFVGILATLFVLLIGLIARSLVSRIIPRPAAAAAGSSAPETLPEQSAAAQQVAGAQPQMAMPPHAQYVAYPQQQAYMAPFMMHPSFVYADVDPREQDRPRRPKSAKPKTKRKRRSASAAKRSARGRINTRPPLKTDAVQDSGSGSTAQSFELDAFDKGKKNTDVESQIYPGVYAKILEQNLQLRNKDGA